MDFQLYYFTSFVGSPCNLGKLSGKLLTFGKSYVEVSTEYIFLLHACLQLQPNKKVTFSRYSPAIQIDVLPVAKCHFDFVHKITKVSCYEWFVRTGLEYPNSRNFKDCRITIRLENDNNNNNNNKSMIRTQS